MSNGQFLRKVQPYAVAQKMAFSPDGSILASADYSEVKLWDVESGKEIRSAALGGLAFWRTALAFSPNGSQLAVVGYRDSVVLLNADDGSIKQILTGQKEPADEVAFSPDGRTLAMVGEWGNVYLWDVPSSQLLRVLYGALGKVSFLGDGRILASEGRNGPLSWDISSLRSWWSTKPKQPPSNPTIADYLEKHRVQYNDIQGAIIAPWMDLETGLTWMGKDSGQNLDWN